MTDLSELDDQKDLICTAYTTKPPHSVEKVKKLNIMCEYTYVKNLTRQPNRLRVLDSRVEGQVLEVQPSQSNDILNLYLSLQSLVLSVKTIRLHIR